MLTQSYLLILGFFVIGVARRHLFNLSEERLNKTTLRANQWIIYVAITAVIFVNVPQLEFTPNALLPALVAWITLLVSALLVNVVANKLKLERDIKGVMLLLVPLGNTSFIGYPMISALLDERVLGYAIFYDQLGSFLALSTYATFILAIFSKSPNVTSASKVTPSYKVIIKKVVTFPPFLSLMTALFVPLNGVLEYTQPVLDLLADTLVPLALFTLGLQFHPKLVPEHIVPLAVSIGIKMMLAPLFVFLALRHISLPLEAFQASVFEAAMPPMMTPGILAIQAGLAPRFTATLLGYTTLLSMITLPFLALLLKSIV